MSEDQLREVKDSNFEELYEKLMAFSLSLAKLYFKKNFKNLPKGYTYEDVVQYAINLALDKSWEDFSLERFESYLFGAVKSKYWALAISADNNRTKRLIYKYEDGSERDSIQIMSEPSTDELVDVLFYKEVLELIEAAIKENQNSEELMLVFNCIKEGLETRQIVERTGLPSNQVTNCKRVLLRIVDRISKRVNNA